MRLIDADELKKELYQQWFMDILLTQRNSEDMFYALAQKIDEHPTAYDADKVVEQLEERSKEYNSGVRLHGKPEEMITTEAIEIVKGGGVNGKEQS